MSARACGLRRRERRRSERLGSFRAAVLSRCFEEAQFERAPPSLIHPPRVRFKWDTSCGREVQFRVPPDLLVRRFQRKKEMMWMPARSAEAIIFLNAQHRCCIALAAQSKATDRAASSTYTNRSSLLLSAHGCNSAVAVGRKSRDVLEPGLCGYGFDF